MKEDRMFIVTKMKEDSKILFTSYKVWAQDEAEAAITSGFGGEVLVYPATDAYAFRMTTKRIAERL